MNGYGSHTFKMINAKRELHYCKFHFKTDQKIKCLYAKRADELAGIDPDYSIRDLYNAIANKNFPSWTLYIQIMTPKQAEESKFNPFDVTKIWPQGDYPLKPVGKLILDRNPSNYFAEVEQIAFSPSHMIPGIEPSPDKMLMGRLFAYPDTHRHRLGANYLQIPVNCPFSVRNYQRDGPQAIHNQGGAPNYFPNSFAGPGNDERAKILAPPFPVSGDVSRYDTVDDDNYTQSKVFYQKVLKDDEKERLISNIADSLKNAADFIQARALKNLKNVDESLVNRLSEALQNYRKPHANL